MKNWQSNEEFLKAVEKPHAVGRYCPIAHDVFIDEIQKGLDERGLVVKSKKYLTANDGKIMTGEYSVQGSNSDLNIGFNFQNSYNKMLTANIRSGAIVLVCKNGMISTRGVKYSRKHLGTGALDNVRANIVKCLDNAENEYQKLIEDMKEMKQLSLSKSVISELVGDMYVNESLITETQLSVLKNELNTSVNFKDDNAWCFYNNVTECLKDNHAAKYINQHLKIYSYLGDRFHLKNSTGLYAKNEELMLS